MPQLAAQQLFYKLIQIDEFNCFLFIFLFLNKLVKVFFFDKRQFGVLFGCDRKKWRFTAEDTQIGAKLIWMAIENSRLK